MSIYEVNDLHIEDFNKDVARVLVFLYDYFPRKLELYIEDIHGPDEIDEYGLHSPRHLACMSAVIWLADEGLIRFDNLVKQESFTDVVLDKKSYLLLSQIIEPSEETQAVQQEPKGQNLPEITYPVFHSRIAMLKRALKAQSSLQLRKAIMSFLEAS